MNDDIKHLIKKHRLKQWEVAQKMGISDVHFSRILRYELFAERRKMILDAIAALKAEQDTPDK